MNVITVPQRRGDSLLLLHRFAQALGIDDSQLVTAGARANPALDAIDVELLRTVTARTAGQLDRRAQRGLINDGLLPVLQRLDRPRRPFRLPTSYQRLMTEAAARDIEAISATGCHVHGDLDELLPGGGAFEIDREARDHVLQADVLNAAIDAVVNMARTQSGNSKGA